MSIGLDDIVGNQRKARKNGWSAAADPLPSAPRWGCNSSRRESNSGPRGNLCPLC